MAFVRPTLAELVDRIEADFISRLSLVGAVLRRAVVRIFARVIAGAAHMLHGHLEFLGFQLFPDLSEDVYLVRQAALFGLAKTPPDFAKATLDLTGEDVDATVPAGTILTRADGTEYATDEDTVVGSTGSVSVTAVVAGAAATLTVGVVLSFQSPISGVDSTAIVASVEQDGTDEETTDALRVRLLERMDDPPHGGNDTDWIAWAKLTAGVTRAWPVGLGLGPGTVLVRFVRDNDVSIIPDAGEVAAVQAVFDEERPAHCTATAFAPVLLAQPFTIAVVPNTAAVKAAVEAELADLFLREGEPGGTILLSAIRTAIGTAAGLTDYTLTVPSANVTHTANQLPSVGVITWN